MARLKNTIICGWLVYFLKSERQLKKLWQCPAIPLIERVFDLALSAFRLEPCVEDVVFFPEINHATLPYAVKQMIAHEIEMEQMRRQEGPNDHVAAAAELLPVEEKVRRLDWAAVVAKGRRGGDICGGERPRRGKILNLSSPG